MPTAVCERHGAAALLVDQVGSSPQMIALARDRMPGQEWIVADMRRLALDHRFDGILGLGQTQAGTLSMEFLP
jgi:trans-aconitate methyltransferase